MYIIELLYKTVVHIIQKRYSGKKSNIKIKDKKIKNKCEHIFLPVDSTKKILACTK